mmetsp:Transcript_28902/g.61363  ORF Transcript_28902/g.61363 Transcript_28902/m.61363 type:complete len:254 (-) Transcript_28902:452-1213(-)
MLLPTLEESSDCCLTTISSTRPFRGDNGRKLSNDEPLPASPFPAEDGISMTSSLPPPAPLWTQNCLAPLYLARNDPRMTSKPKMLSCGGGSIMLANARTADRTIPTVEPEEPAEAVLAVPPCSSRRCRTASAPASSSSCCELPSAPSLPSPSEGDGTLIRETSSRSSLALRNNFVAPPMLSSDSFAFFNWPFLSKFRNMLAAEDSNSDKSLKREVRSSSNSFPSDRACFVRLPRLPISPTRGLLPYFVVLVQQ